MEKVWNELVSGLRRYCETNHLTDVTFGLSGGMDSALVAVLAVDALGKDHVHTVFMPSKHSSDLSRQIATEMAAIHGFEYQECSIQDLTDYTLQQVNTLLKGKAPNNAVKENLQARIRGPILLGIMGNQYGYLVLACGNKSEAMMGYSTFGGDTFGGFAPIAQLLKTQVYELAQWRNTVSYAFPKAVLTRPPSAELSEGQTDEGSLAASYAVIDTVIVMREAGYSAAMIADAKVIDKADAERLFKVMDNNAFKRCCMAKSIAVNAPLALAVRKLLPQDFKQHTR